LASASRVRSSSRTWATIAHPFGGGSSQRHPDISLVPFVMTSRIRPVRVLRNLVGAKGAGDVENEPVYVQRERRGRTDRGEAARDGGHTRPRVAPSGEDLARCLGLCGVGAQLPPAASLRWNDNATSSPLQCIRRRGRSRSVDCGAILPTNSDEGQARDRWRADLARAVGHRAYDWPGTEALDSGRHAAYEDTLGDSERFGPRAPFRYGQGGLP
jgi:hypothetical protein